MISQWFLIPLIILAISVFLGLIKRKNVWLLICAYWIALAVKLFLEGFGL